MKFIMPVMLLGAACHSFSLAAKPISGKVEDQSGKVLAETLINIHGSQGSQSTTTDLNGLFTADLEPGDYTIDIEGGSQSHFHQSINVTDEPQDSFLITLTLEADHKLVIRANPLEHTALDMATPTILLAGDELTLKRASSLGEILQYEPGLSVSSFGPAVSRPVIRGLGGSRVTITNNQMTVQDASTTSGDHDVGIEPLLAEQIDVVKGPATLLYGSGAIGGVINVSDRKINADINPGLSGGVEMRLGDSATGEQSLIMALDGGTENWNWHLDAFKSDTDPLKIPGSAESEILHEAEGHDDHDEKHEEDHEEEEHEEEGHEDEHHEEEDLIGLLENSQSETQGGSLGTTFVGDWGHIGGAVSFVEKTYGVPGHAHHEEEHDEGHEEEHEEEEHNEDEHHDEGVVIEMKQTRYDLQAEINNPLKGIDNWFVGFSLTDYEHVELEGDEVGTRFDNEAWELKSYLKHENWQGWSGVWGVQISERDFSAIGHEAFVPPSLTENQALFLLEEKVVGNLKLELGARFESQSVTVDGMPQIDESGMSISFGNVYTISEHNKLALNYSRATRFATVEELFSQGEHAATLSYESGNANLTEEISNNLDLSYRFENDFVSGEFNLFWNQFEDFIYGANVDEMDPCLPAGVGEEAHEEGLQLICYQQQDANFKGIEFHMTIPLNSGSQHEFSIGLLADYVKAEFDDNSLVPRIPTSKKGVSLNYYYHDLSAGLHYLSYDDKNKVAANELPTMGFDMVNLDIAYRLPFGEDDLFLFFKGKNLLDEEARDHSSLVKDLAPRAGRNFVMGARYTF